MQDEVTFSGGPSRTIAGFEKNSNKKMQVQFISNVSNAI